MSNTASNTTKQSGTFELPEMLPLEDASPISKIPMIIGQFCYILKDYKPGLSVVMRFDGEHSGFSIGDWTGNHYTPESKEWPQCAELLMKVHSPILQTLINIKVPQAQFYFDNEGKLVDMRTSINKFVGPGMLRDIFGNLLPIQETIEIVQVTDEKIDEVKKNGGAIVKPSMFKTMVVKNDPVPLYARI